MAHSRPEPGNAGVATIGEVTGSDPVPQCREVAHHAVIAALSTLRLQIKIFHLI